MKWTTKQTEAFGLLGQRPRILLYGGSQSGKTRAIAEFFVRACLTFEGLRILFVRQRRQHAKESVWHETLLGDVLPRYAGAWSPNYTDLFISFVNGSEIWVSGTDEKERIDKVLGRGIGGVYLNEVSQISYTAYTTIRTRISQKVEGWVARLVADCNPPAPTHWVHKVFIEHIEPTDGGKLHAARYGSLLMNPADNLANLREGYLEDLDELPDAQRRRFRDGEFVQPAGAVFSEYSDIECPIEKAPDCEQYVVGVDMVTYAAVLVGFQRYTDGSRIRRKVYVVDEWQQPGTIAHEANTAIASKWGRYRYTAYIDHNLGEAGTREFDNSRLARKGPGSVDAGISELQTAMHLGDFHVVDSCSLLRYQLQNYRRDEAGVIIKEDDHLIDALRMAVYSISAGRVINVV